MSSGQRIGAVVSAVAGVLMLVVVVACAAHDLIAALGEQHRDHVACAESRIEAAQRGEQDLRACGEGKDVGVHDRDAAVKAETDA